MVANPHCKHHAHQPPSYNSALPAASCCWPCHTSCTQCLDQHTTAPAAAPVSPCSCDTWLSPPTGTRLSHSSSDPIGPHLRYIPANISQLIRYSLRPSEVHPHRYFTAHQIQSASEVHPHRYFTVHQISSEVNCYRYCTAHQIQSGVTRGQIHLLSREICVPVAT